MQQPFQWSGPIDESKPEGGVFYGDSISDRWTSRREQVVEPSRGQAFGALKDWFSGAPERQVPCLHGPYGIGKTSILKRAIQQQMPGKRTLSIEIGVHGSSLGVEMSGSIQQFADRFLTKQFDGLSSEIRDLVEKFWNPAVNGHQLARELLECAAVPKDSELHRTALRVIDTARDNSWLMLTNSLLRFYERSLELRYLMEACRVEGPQRIERFVKWARSQDPPPVLLVYADPASPMPEELTLRPGGPIAVFDLFEKHSVPFLFEWRNLTFSSKHKTLLENILRRPIATTEPLTSYRFVQGMKLLRIPALRSEEALDCICGHHTRAQALGGIRPPRFCPERDAISAGRPCSKGPRLCRQAQWIQAQTGTWPLLVQAVCSHLDGDERSGEGMQMVKACLEELKPVLWGHIYQWWSTLPEEEQSIFISWLEGKSYPTQKQYDRLSELGVAFRVGRGRWRIPNLVKEWRRQSISVKEREIRANDMTQPEHLYNLFVSYADADRAWVEGYLLDALQAAGVRVNSEEAFRLGVPRILEFERAIQQSQRTLLILSPAYLAEGFSQFTDLLAQSYGLETATWPVIPLILHPVQLPPRLAMLTALDASDPDTWPRVLERLLADLGMVHNWLTLSQPVENSDDLHSPKTGGKRRSSGRFTGFCSVTRAVSPTRIFKALKSVNLFPLEIEPSQERRPSMDLQTTQFVIAIGSWLAPFIVQGFGGFVKGVSEGLGKGFTEQVWQLLQKVPNAAKPGEKEELMRSPGEHGERVGQLLLKVAENSPEEAQRLVQQVKPALSILLNNARAVQLEDITVIYQRLEMRAIDHGRHRNEQVDYLIAWAGTSERLEHLLKAISSVRKDLFGSEAM